MDQIRVVELFAGVGGFRLGLEAASPLFSTIWMNQWEQRFSEQYAFQCYESHFGHSENHICKDIARVKADVPAHDMLVGGFPCQDYSVANKYAKGIEGKRGALWWHINDIIREKRPKLILLENVDRLLWSPAKQKGRDIAIILRCLYQNHYAVEWRVINAADYGQAQRRRRVFLLAHRNDTPLFMSLAESLCTNGLKSAHQYIIAHGTLAKAFPVSGHATAFTDDWIDEFRYQDIGALSSLHRGRFFNAGIMINGRIYTVDVYPAREPPVCLSAVLQEGNISERYYIKERDLPAWKYAKGAKQEYRTRRDGSKYYFSEGKMAFPDPLNKPSRTMLTSESEISRMSHVVKDPSTEKLRTLTPTECERLNGFPDGWTNTGMPDKIRYFTMGNALVVPLVTRIGKTIANAPSVFFC